MGEAKRRQHARDKDFQDIDAALKEAGIDVSTFGFYDQPQFVALEREDPRALELYARWVLGRPRNVAYEKRAQEVVPRLTCLIERRLASENGVGACVNVATMMARMLDRLEIWSFAVQGSLTVEVPSQPEVGRRYFPECDLLDHDDNVTGHGWLVAPPYVIVDPTLKHQQWVDLHPTILSCLPDVVLSEQGELARPRWFDVVSDSLIAKYNLHRADLTPELPYRFKPDLAHVEKFLPGRKLQIGKLGLLYIAGAVKISDVSLEQLPSVSLHASNLTPKRIWKEYVCPEFGIAH